ncbi:extracellular solute-binding protein [Streptomyces sp. NBC_01537]|uniref:extracellular solute-binding protein n=1 Tax=Streptomyces sp. NBC_01537 TaxID=2903896 RepID=UPI003870E9B6
MPVSPRGSLDRRRFLAASAGAALTAAALPGCASSVDSGSGAKGAKETLTIMDVAWTKEDKQKAERALGMNLDIITFDVTKLNAMLAGNNPPDVVRGVGATDVPYFAARDLMADLDPYFAKSDVLKPSDLAAANDVWRYDSEAKKQGTGPRYGMAKDYSQDCMFWYRTDLFEAAKLELPSDTEPLSCDEWLDLGKRLVKRRLGKVKVYGLSAGALNGPLTTFLWMTASAGGSLFAEDLATVDFSSPEALKALTWYLDYAKSDIGPSVVNPNPDGWDWPTYQANRMAMANDGYWFGGSIGGDAKVSEVSRFAPAPQLGSNRVSPCFGGTGYWVPKGAKNKDAAWKYFEYYFGGKLAQDRATTGWGIPSLKSLVPKMPQDTAFHKQSYEVQQRELPYFSVLPVSPYAQMDALNVVLTKVLPDAVKSGTAAGKIADALNSRINDQLARGKELVG